MKLGTALFLAYFLILALCFTYPIAHFAGDVRRIYLQGVEEPLVDQSNLLAAVVGAEMETGRFDSGRLFTALREGYARRIEAMIYDYRKEHLDAQVYITDANGIVIFDSEDRDNIGADYSRYRDVSLTLKGEYGARTTRKVPDDPATAVLYVAAPIRSGGRTVGVLTVGEPTTSVNALIRSAQPRIIRIGILSALMAVGASLLVSLWISGQISKLTQYAKDAAQGRRVDLPELAPTELREMGVAFDRMRESLEGKKYVEQYVQTLTHEIKSPVSAIRGAAELLGEEMPPAKRAQFLDNIRDESARIQDLVERMLKLSELETRKSLDATEVIPLAPLLRSVLESKESLLSLKRLKADAEMDEAVSVTGDRFLLHQAISNLLQNAIDFSPAGGRIVVRATAAGRAVAITVEDEGPGIPAYALEKVFEKFFSLQRPDTGRKSTGLGLTLVKEVAGLHGGRIQLENLPAGADGGTRGLRATLGLPAA